jgi:radical SAM protein with 4Fe4S-binding SPASM domain
VVVDYVLFEHNRHEEKAVRRFCHDNGIVFTLRYGRTFVDSGVSSPSESRCHYTPKITPCDWAWGVMVVCHDGRVVPCCQFATCAESPLVMGDAGDESAVAVWNGPLYRSFRRTQASGGRRSLPLCSNCFYSGIDFQS